MKFVFGLIVLNFLMLNSAQGHSEFKPNFKLQCPAPKIQRDSLVLVYRECYHGSVCGFKGSYMEARIAGINYGGLAAAITRPGYYELVDGDVPLIHMAPLVETCGGYRKGDPIEGGYVVKMYANMVAYTSRFEYVQLSPKRNLPSFKNGGEVLVQVPGVTPGRFTEMETRYLQGRVVKSSADRVWVEVQFGLFYVHVTDFYRSRSVGNGVLELPADLVFPEVRCPNNVCTGQTADGIGTMGREIGAKYHGEVLASYSNGITILDSRYIRPSTGKIPQDDKISRRAVDSKTLKRVSPRAMD